MAPKTSAHGFTIIELLLSMGIIALLAAIVIVAINPTRQLAQGRNTVRQADIVQIIKAVQQYTVENDSTLPAGIDGTLRMIGTDATGCAVACSADTAEPFALSIPVTDLNDDAEEFLSNSDMYLGSGDLEFIHDYDPTRLDQMVGIRFQNVTIPPGAVITNASIRFTAEEASNPGEDGTLTLHGEAADNAAIFVNNDGNISDRPQTSASVVWPFDNTWLYNLGEVDSTPDIAAVAQEIIDRPSWASGNSMVFIIEGTPASRRVAASANGGGVNEVPRLFIDYTTTNQNTAAACLDLGGLLAPEFVASVPNDPLNGNAGKTYYAVQQLSDNRIRVRSCAAEMNEVIFADQ